MPILPRLSLPGSVRLALLVGLCGVPFFCFAPAWSADSAAPLDQLLHRSERFAERFWQRFPDVTCNETVIQAKLGKNGKVTYQREALFDYLVFLDLQSDGIGVTESRQAKREPGKDPKVPLLVTNGFSTMVLIFHSYYQNSFEFESQPDDAAGGKTLQRIHFRHVKGTRSPSVLQLRGRDYPLDLEGTAWFDPEAGAIVRIESVLEAPMDDVGLRVFRSDVHYSPVRFSASTEIFWLPAAAEIEAETPRQHWRNIHHFTDYKLFSTDAHEKEKK
jgi:hypothetical protein